MVDVAHGDVRHHNVLHPALVNLFEGQSRGIGECRVGKRDVAVAAVALSAEFEASADPSYGLGHVGAVEQRAALIAGDVTVRDGDVLAEHGLLQCVARLEHEGIVAGGVDAAVGDGHILTAVDVEAVAVGVDGDVVDGSKVAAGHDDGEVSAAVDGDVADGHLSAELQGYGLVAGANGAALHVAGVLGVFLRQSLAVDHAVAGNGDVALTLGPDEGVVEIGVTTVLVFGKPAEGLALVVESAAIAAEIGLPAEVLGVGG